MSATRRRFAYLLAVSLASTLLFLLTPGSALADGEVQAGSNPEPFLASVRQQIANWEQNLPETGTERFNTLVNLARAYFILGDLSKDGHIPYFEKGKHYAELILKDHPGWADGHYWLGLNQAGLAEYCGAGNALRTLPNIMEELERAAKIDPTYDQGGAHRVLGRIYYEAPSWPICVGDLHKSLHHLSRAVRVTPRNSTNQLFLAETLLKLGKKAQAKKALEAVLAATENAVWPQGIEEDRHAALNHLAELRKTALKN